MNTKTIFLFLFSIIFGTECMAQCSPQGVDPVTFPRIYMSDGSVLTALFDDETQSVEFSLEATDTSAEFTTIAFLFLKQAITL